MSGSLSSTFPNDDLAEYRGGLRIFTRAGPGPDLCSCGFRVSASPSPAPGLQTPQPPGRIWFDAALIECGTDPFPYLLGVPAIPAGLACSLLRWLDESAFWRSTDGGFYSVRQYDLRRARVPEGLEEFFDDACLRETEQLASEIFGQPLRLCEELPAHRNDAGQGVGIHSDRPEPDGETHRILLTLARELSPASGGHLVLLAGPEPADARRLIPLRHNMAIAFALTDASHHAVTMVTSGRRFAIVFSFRPARS